MDLINNLAVGFDAAVTLQNLGFCLLGCLLGTLVGVLPGLGPVAAISVLLPITFGLDPLSSLIMLAGIYYGAQYGGSTTAILINMPGETSSVVTCLDGYQMAKKGRGGAALAIAALASLLAGCFGTLVVAAFAPVLGQFAKNIASAEYFALLVLGLIAAVALASRSVLKAVAMILLGLLVGLFGIDITSGVPRYTFGFDVLEDGVDFVVVALGLFGFAEIMVNLERGQKERDVPVAKVDSLWPNKSEVKRSWKAALRGTGIGCLIGILPGGGGTLSSFASYTIERELSRNKSEFGSGAVEGVAGPEAANNAGVQTSFIPLLTLGIPPNPVSALMLGALLIHNITPGPNIIEEQPTLFWGLIASMWIGNLMLVVINLPLIRLWVSLLKVPYRLLYPCIVIFGCLGIYLVNNNPFELALAAVFAILGYVFLKLGCESAPFLLGFVLGPMMEENLRRAMLVSRGDPMIFIERPICLAILLCTIALILVMTLSKIRGAREKVLE
ncbi:Tripartite tricarboxylate transporter TctA family protein [compost metagenome]